MSTTIGKLKNTGGRGVDMEVTRFWGGERGVCIQLSAEQDEGMWGYIQLNKRDFKRLKKLAKEVF